MEDSPLPGPADVEYFTRAQSGSWGDMLRAFARFVGPIPGGYILDVGSGPGLLVRLCAGEGARLAVACDDSWAMAQRAAGLGRLKPGVSVLAGSAPRLPLSTGTFDAVLATNLLFLLPEPSDGLSDLVRVARSGGTVAFLNPGERMSQAAAEAFADDRGMRDFDRFSFLNYGRLAESGRRLSESGWLALAEANGLTSLRSETRAGGLVVFAGGTKA
jgi:SAM-dependent methyltransferase